MSSDLETRVEALETAVERLREDAATTARDSRSYGEPRSGPGRGDRSYVQGGRRRLLRTPDSDRP